MVHEVRVAFQIMGGYTFEKINGGTKVTQRIVADIEGFFRLAIPIVARSTKRNLENNLRTLKDVLESVEREEVGNADKP